MKTDVLIVGAGFSGSVVARQLAERGYEVLVIDKREHIGGNAYDRKDQHGILIHPYGPHIFHTNADRIAEYLTQFTAWRPYEHRVLAKVEEKFVPIPINIDTVNALYGMDLDETTIQGFYDSVREPREKIRTSEDVVINAVGQDLYEKFFRGYTQKQWGLDPSELNAAVAARVPTRTDRDDRYFTDKFQKMPAQGYTKMFESMLDHPSIKVELGVDYFEFRERVEATHTVYTGPLDAFYAYCYGKLPYRSLRFEHEHLADTEWYQSVGTVNFPNDYEYTRTTEFKHLTGQQHSGTSLVREFPTAEGDPYYPVPRPENELLFKRYEALAEQEQDVTFVGRLAQYRYYNMDQCVGAALKSVDYILEKMGETSMPVPPELAAAMSHPQATPLIAARR
ncbi:UDP-galactopyranose mutase [Cognatilysobacter lacus]|uniref:UDP-galactopyranose mutase n=1 Tax=Cognatilysobacter lacus TaxID=1643323 RepID=A0A5D8Z8Q4_9GAMM|nr:UDP-galactopyranose mutase [Lysobacter lacus]TZF90946.1 UDP-galactopyranose mutase [Lysobacter lacus]